ncbi:ATP-binding cassette domain-containing protein [Longibaculum muris]|uniref:ATP-binding cassette domain-containing protein n=1 Tax=Longibaculum muris TaxID=1796628 RepID=UPI0022E32C69|nr:ATP-binding cassette domain-containing protein [Longibaculum muris]
MLEIKDIHISFDRNIFNNTQIQFYSSSIHAIVGKSGSGKTTFLKSIIHDSSFSQSKMYYNHEEIHQKDDFVRNHVAYVDQLGSYFPNMSIKQHFQFYAEMKKEKIDVQKINRCLEKVNLNNVNINKSPSVLSIGERKRMLIALAIFCDKDIIILDEPTASLDKKNISLLKKILLSLEDKTVILTTHTPEILEICDVVYKIENHEFHCQKNDIDKTQEPKIKLKNNYQFSSIKYFRYKSLIQWIQYIGIIAISLFILIQSSLIINSFLKTTNVNPQVTNQSSKEMLFIRSREGELIWDYFPSSDINYSKPFNEKDLNKVKQMKGVKEIKKFEVLTLFNPDNMDESQNLNVISKSGTTKTYSVNDNGSFAPRVYPYYEDNDFNDHDNGVYISYGLSQVYNIHEGDTIKAKFYIPRNQYIKNNGEEYRSITYTLRELEFKVGKIIEGDGYETGVTDLIIYIPYENLMNTISHIDEKEEIISNYYIDNVLSKQVSAQPYTMNEYVLFVDEDYVLDINNSILEMDDEYDTFSTYLNYLEYDKMGKEAFQTKLLSFAAICSVGLIALLTTQYFLMKSRKKEFQILEDSGVQDKDTKKSLLLENSIYFIIISIAGFLWLYINREQYAYITQYLAVLGISFILLLLMHAVSHLVLKKK